MKRNNVFHALEIARIARDLALVMLDALEPFGYGRVFPRGMLREPLGGLGRICARTRRLGASPAAGS